MKLVQSMNPSRTYMGVTFPKGVAVELPADFPPDHAQHLLDWGWDRVDAPEPQAQDEPDPAPVTDASETEPAPEPQAQKPSGRRR